uniref:U47-Deinotoxin-Dsu1b_1 n=1 Tax=Deinopis subrufa TaxID=1905329 RepID=A0A4Q8KD47_DEISU
MKLQLIFICVALFIFVNAKQESKERSLEEFASQETERCPGKYDNCRRSSCCKGLKCRCNYEGWFEYKCKCK